MNAAALADLLHARRVGPGRWVARCPSHPDKTPSLSIRETGDKILLHDFGGCAPSAILGALGLSWTDVSKPLSPEQRREAARLRAQREAAEQQARLHRREAWARVDRWQAIVDVLGSKLARSTDGAEADALADLFHRSCDRLHDVENQAAGDGRG